jgi:hypothetical protein
MAKKTRRGKWLMASDRELMTLSKTHALKALAEHFKREPDYIIKKAMKLALSIKRKAN